MPISMIVLGLCVLLLIAVISAYNRLVLLRNRVKNAFSQIDVQLKRRHDLIPNLVETAKAYLAHERQTLEAVIAARNTASAASQRAAEDPTNAPAMRQLVGAETALGGALGRFYAVAESYPELKADTNMQQLSEELTSTENRITFARQGYNDAVTDYNTTRDRFPAVLVANNFGFHSAELYELQDAAEREVPRVAFG